MGSIPQFYRDDAVRGSRADGFICHLSPYYRHPNDVGLWQCTHRAYRFDTQYHSGFGGRRTDGMAGLPVGYDDRNHYADDPRFGCRTTPFTFINHGAFWSSTVEVIIGNAILRSFRTIGTPIILTSVVICANSLFNMTPKASLLYTWVCSP